jgi:hypothetical protein
MGLALEINFALWVMIACGVAELSHFASYLN